MSTDRTFSLNSILPSSYMNKAEAFAKCLQDKLRSLGSGEETAPNCGTEEDFSKTTHESLNKFSEEQIADNVFLQGPLSYKRRSIPDNGNKTNSNGKHRGKYFGSIVDKRGMSSDSEDSEGEVAAASVHPRVAELQIAGGGRLRRLASVNSIDSTSSWCSCEEGPDPEEDEVIDTFAAQIKGSPPIHNPRMRNFKRKSREEKQKVERTPPAPEVDLFFDFDIECFSPVDIDDDIDEADGFESARLRLHENFHNTWSPDFRDIVDTGQTVEEKGVISASVDQTLPVATPPPSPVNPLIPDSDNIHNLILLKEAETNDSSNVSFGVSVGQEADNIELKESEVSSSYELTIKQSSDLETSPDGHNTDYQKNETNVQCNECTESEYHHFENDSKDSGIGSCEESSSRTEDEDILDVAVDSCEEALTLVGFTDTANYSFSENSPVVKTNVTSPITVLCDGVEIDASYLPSPRMKLRRCSSLKTWKTPPGTPGRKKIVRFADALGLDLADVRMFLDEVPKVPNSAFEDLHYELPPAPPPPTAERTLIPMFQQPGTQLDFLQRVRQKNVSLESAILTDITLLSISGIVRVRNLSFHKTVHVRYSKDNWASFSDLQATFVPNSSDGFCDNFSFTLYGHTLNIGDKLEFAIRYDCATGQFWDNNGGVNYAFQCMPRSPMPLFPPLGSSPVDTWNNKFY